MRPTSPNIRLIDRVAQTCTVDLFGRKPTRFISGLDGISLQLITHFSNGGCYPEATGTYWQHQGSFRAAIALERWLCAVRPSGLVHVEIHGFTDAGDSRVRSYAVHVSEAGHERYVDPTGVYAVSDYQRRTQRSLGITQLETVPRPQDERRHAELGRRLIQSPPPAIEAVPVYRFLCGLFPLSVIYAARKGAIVRDRDFEMPDLLYHVTEESNLRSIQTVGLLASSMGKHHDLRSYGSPTQGIYLSASPTPGELDGEMSPVFDKTVDSSSWVILAVRAQYLEDSRFFPDPAGYEAALADPCLSTPDRMARFLGTSPAKAEALYDQIRRSGRCGFSWTAARLWRWSLMRSQSVLYGASIPRQMIEGSHRYHPRCCPHLKAKRELARSSTDGNSQHFIRNLPDRRKHAI